MECRTSLFLPEETKPLTPPSYSVGRQRGQPSWYTGRVQSSSSSTHRSVVSRTSNSGSPSPKIKPKPKERKRFPLAKNLVLLSLMEAVVAAGENEMDAARHLSNKVPRGNEAEDEDINIEIASSRLSSACGTYAVIAEEGVPILRKGTTSCNKATKRYRSITSPVNGNSRSNFYKRVLARSKSKDSQIEQEVRNILNDMDLKSESTACMESGDAADCLNVRDRVQIVCIVDGLARLSRGRGFVAANQLVKVGPPLDKSCRIEGLLHSLSLKHASVKKEVSETKHLLLSLKKELNVSLLGHDSTIIRALPENSEIPYESSQVEELLEQSDLSIHITSTPASNNLAGVINIRNSPTYSTEEKKTDGRIDFRTGMSGHLALGNYTISHYFERVYDGTKAMSSHTGLNIPKTPKLDSRDNENQM